MNNPTSPHQEATLVILVCEALGKLDHRVDLGRGTRSSRNEMRLASAIKFKSQFERRYESGPRGMAIE